MTFEEVKAKHGLVHAIALQCPGYSAEVRRVKEERERLIAMRQRMIRYVQGKEGIGFTEAEAIVDGKASAPLRG